MFVDCPVGSSSGIMTNPKGYRRGTRHMFERKFRRHGNIPLSTYMKVYKKGDRVDIKVQLTQSTISWLQCGHQHDVLLCISGISSHVLEKKEEFIFKHQTNINNTRKH